MSKDKMKLESFDKKLPGTIKHTDHHIVICNIDKLNGFIHLGLMNLASCKDSELITSGLNGKHLFIRRFSNLKEKKRQSEQIGRYLADCGILAKNNDSKRIKGASVTKKFSKDIDFENILNISKNYVEHINKNKNDILNTLTKYETYIVAKDEVRRAIDYLENLERNKQYFEKYIEHICSFIPLNQPFYSLVCFGLVPSFMAHQVAVRPPSVTHELFKELLSKIGLQRYFPNVELSFEDKDTFVRKNEACSDAVIFTGTPLNGRRLRKRFSRKAIFILNGMGHNPIVVTT